MEYIQIDNEGFYKIANSDALRPFFMSIVSDSNHWMFISSNGGLSAGRKNSDYALFPYYTDDKITESFDTTGSKSIFQVNISGKKRIWEPFSNRYTGVFDITRNLYKNEHGNKVLFEEVNHDLKLTFQYQWNSSDRYGFVRKSTLINQNDNVVEINVLDGLQNIMPYGVVASTQQGSSNLVDAYKRTELIKDAGLGIFALSAIIVDKAEPSEALKANVVYGLGLDTPKILLSSKQLDTFRSGHEVIEEVDVKAERGAYFMVKPITLNAHGQKQWALLADVNKSTAKVIDISKEIKINDKLWDAVFDDVENGTERLLLLTNSADGKQLTADRRTNTRHHSNVMFNIMRGGIFDNNYSIEKEDFATYIEKANKAVFSSQKETLKGLSKKFTQKRLKEIAAQSSDKDFVRLCLEYLPLKFSRRHGDPSRPWNRFSINTTDENGKKVLDYEGNWRDIFQNWEALAHSYPEFIEGMIFKFLNATTFDGYNPYRVTKDGFDWEIIEPDDPWSYIGYWGDHQIIYLLKFLEFAEDHYPKLLTNYFDKDVFVYANVPYVIKNYESILKYPKDTIEFHDELDSEIRERRNEVGADGALLRTKKNEIYRVNFIEKILATLLAKCSNLIPEGGIWMNTQRPEWNDANNALVGNGVSMVTLYYMRRFFTFFDTLVTNASFDEVSVSKELETLFKTVLEVFDSSATLISKGFSDQQRKKVMDRLGMASSEYRTLIYKKGFTSKKTNIGKDDLHKFIVSAQTLLDQSIRVNKREDGLYHAYNLMTVENDNEVSLSYLNEMLEGQVAVLSSGYLSANESLSVLDKMKASKLFREDQYSYLLYPNKELPGFTSRNTVPDTAIKNSRLLQQLLKDGNTQIIEQNVEGGYHFNGNFNNASSLNSALETLNDNYLDLVKEERKPLLDIFEAVFNHKAFTGRSGTFYGYEGLGSIYWHMVSKLLLAVQETCLSAIEANESDEIVGRLLEHYYEINEGIGVHKSPELYGAFPTDPYSHTPAGKGAQQPGMTGQVKEDILSRFGELGVFVKNGQLLFNPVLLRKEEFLKKPSTFSFVTIAGKNEMIDLKADMICFTYCQVPVIYQLGEFESVTVHMKDATKTVFDKLVMDQETSQMVFERTDKIQKILVCIKK
ncbi:hypothetical protein [uncultured Croceitalea sp.]|uniref:hypothetical protein n=1 Tax=uncultured Croceitalea sp. TaxID=1798908 RepID=UPI0033065E21